MLWKINDFMITCVCKISTFMPLKPMLFNTYASTKILLLVKSTSLIAWQLLSSYVITIEGQQSINLNTKGCPRRESPPTTTTTLSTHTPYSKSNSTHINDHSEITH